MVLDRLSKDVMENYLKVCEKAVRTGGSVLRDKLGRISVREKAPADLVTEADLASQEVMFRTIQKAFPNHAFLGEEEQLESTGMCDESEFRWIADPLDGTTNYVHQVPFFSVSLALERSGTLLVGAVYNPISEECFTAFSGGGAWLNGTRISTSVVQRSSESMASIGFPPGVTLDSPDLRAFLGAVPRCQSIRRTGSAALNLAFVAAGRFDASWSFSVKPWDVAAGVLLIQEAGGIVTSPDGGEFCLENARFLAAANESLHAELITMLRSSVGFV